MLNLGNLDICLFSFQSCSSDLANVMTKHILCMGLLNDIPVCSVGGLNDTVAPLMGMKHVVVLAFKVL